jgi:hypothetical protein
VFFLFRVGYKQNIEALANKDKNRNVCKEEIIDTHNRFFSKYICTYLEWMNHLAAPKEMMTWQCGIAVALATVLRTQDNKIVNSNPAGVLRL